MSGTPMVAAQGITREYPLPDRKATRLVLAGVELELRPGEAVLVSGASGCGKTTLLSILGGLERATGGSLRLFGLDAFTLSASNLTTLRRERIGFGFQSPQLLADLTARENALLPLLPRNLALGEAADRVDALFEELGIRPLARSRTQLLSGGEQQRVALVRALAPEPELLLLDEPAAHLDAASREILARLLRRALTRGAAILLTSHEGFGLGWVQRHLQLTDGRLEVAP